MRKLPARKKSRKECVTFPNKGCQPNNYQTLFKPDDKKKGL